MSHIYPQAQPFFLKGSQETALLFIHGFTASPSELYPTAQLIYDLCGYTLSGPLLPGHGSNPCSLNKSSWEEWYNAVRKELNFLMENINLFISIFQDLILFRMMFMKKFLLFLH